MKPLVPLILLTIAAAAQQAPTRPAPTGTVIGHVLCADTQRPARLAQVKLVRVPSSDEKPTRVGFGDAAPAGDPVQTSLDGSYTLRHVKPGQYYVVVDQEGYLVPLAAFSGKDLTSTDDATRARIAAVTHTITVTADQTTREDVTLQRGASLSGTVLYDDGSPASGIALTLLVRDPASKEPKWIESHLDRYHSIGSRTTDDIGHYRLSGLPAGEYTTEADLSLSEQQSQTGPMPGNSSATIEFTMMIIRFSLPLYSGDVFRKTAAVPYTLGTAEVRTGSNLTFPLAKLHRVTGQVITKSGHAINAGSVTLLYADDKAAMTGSTIDFEDQAFHLDYVPEGDFLLEVKEPKDVRKVQVDNAPGFLPRTHEETKTVTSYGEAEQPLQVKGDQSDVLITVPPAKPASK